MQQTEIFGTFDGVNMISRTGDIYSVPTNYASKSKLVDRDELVLRIQPDGQFFFKMVKPASRRRLFADVGFDGHFFACTDKESWNIPTATANYFHLVQGDTVSILAGKEWCAVENVLPRQG